MRAYKQNQNFVIRLVLTALFFVGGAAMADEELPRYAVVEDFGGGAEIRLYAPMILAEVDVKGSRSEAATAGFRILAAYIFGKNKKQEEIGMTAPVTQVPPESEQSEAPVATENDDASEKIEMTAPVTQVPNAKGDANGWTITFLMPARYTMETLPLPIDERIRIRQTEPQRAIVLRFSGRITDKNMRKHREELDEIIASRGLQTLGKPIYAYYNGPFTPFFLRRNEVMYYLQDKEAA
ncbi:MAG: heme-binding protein [Pseudomonadota bacterium]